MCESIWLGREPRYSKASPPPACSRAHSSLAVSTFIQRLEKWTYSSRHSLVDQSMAMPAYSFCTRSASPFHDAVTRYADRHAEFPIPVSQDAPHWTTHLSVELENQSKHSMSGWMLWTKVDRLSAESRFAQELTCEMSHACLLALSRLAKDLFGAEFMEPECEWDVADLCDRRTLLRSGRGEVLLDWESILLRVERGRGARR